VTAGPGPIRDGCRPGVSLGVRWRTPTARTWRRPRRRPRRRGARSLAARWAPAEQYRPLPGAVARLATRHECAVTAQLSSIDGRLSV